MQIFMTVFFFMRLFVWGISPEQLSSKVMTQVVYFNLVKTPSSCSLSNVDMKGKENVGKAHRILHNLGLRKCYASFLFTVHWPELVMDTLKFKGAGKRRSQLDSSNLGTTIHCRKRSHTSAQAPFSATAGVNWFGLVISFYLFF